MTGIPSVDRLIHARDRTFSEIQELDEEVEFLRGVIIHKRQCMQNMSQQIIERQETVQRISLVSVQPKWKVMRRSVVPSGLSVTLRCLEGGLKTTRGRQLQASKNMQLEKSLLS